MSSFFIGDPVWLKNDPDVCMTVVGIGETGITCNWFNSSRELYEGTFPAEALNEAESEEDEAAGELGAIPPVARAFGT